MRPWTSYFVLIATMNRVQASPYNLPHNNEAEVTDLECIRAVLVQGDSGPSIHSGWTRSFVGAARIIIVTKRHRVLYVSPSLVDGIDQSGGAGICQVF